MTASGTKNEKDTVLFKVQRMDDCHETQKQIHYFNGWMAAIRVVK